MKRIFLATDTSVAVELGPEVLQAMLEVCRASGQLETGGILIGKYGDYGDRVIVSRITGPPGDSRRLPASFIRGVAGLAQRLRTEWRHGLYYVGEWHFHPWHSPSPSLTDRRQIRDFADDPALLCPRPVLLIIGGDPNARPDLWAGVVGADGLDSLREVDRAPVALDTQSAADFTQ